MTRMYVVVPCYNEEAVLMETASRLRKKLEELTAQGRIAPGSRVLFVNDGSKDRTWELIAQLHREPAGGIFRPEAQPEPGATRMPCWPD